jgi:hypothetical protein
MNKKTLSTRRFIIFLTFFLSFSCSGGQSSPDKEIIFAYPYQNYPTSYQQYNPPSSRIYRNPYNFPPRNYYQYYDFDQYYVPPTQYRNIETQTMGAGGKF